MRLDYPCKAIFCFFALFIALVQLMLLSSCSPKVDTPTLTPSPLKLTITPSQVTLETVEEDTPILGDPTATPAPFVALVNGEGILLEDFQVELKLYEAVVGTSLATSDVDIVIQDMIDEVLLAQAAFASGFVVDEELILDRIQELGLSPEALSKWKEENGYSEEGFLRAMKRSIAAAWMRDQLIAEVSIISEQVHARQILLYNLPEAESVYAQLQAGTDFGSLAAEYDAITEGDLGWFPRGYLTVPELDDVLFTLEIGEFSPIIETSLGYHIVQVLERDENHPLSANAHQVVQYQLLSQWLEGRREESDIILFLP